MNQSHKKDVYDVACFHNIKYNEQVMLKSERYAVSRELSKPIKIAGSFILKMLTILPRHITTS